MKPLLAGAAAAFFLAWTGSAAAAEPAATVRLTFLSQGAGGAYFLADGTQSRTGDRVEFWTFLAHPEIQVVDDERIVGGWVRQVADCAGRTMGIIEMSAVREDFNIAFRVPHASSYSPEPDSVGEDLLDYVCSGDPLVGDIVVAEGVAEALRLSHTPGALPENTDLPALTPENRT